VPPQLDYRGQLAAFDVSLADGRGGGFIDNEHGANMIVRIVARQITIEREPASSTGLLRIGLNLAYPVVTHTH